LIAALAVGAVLMFFVFELAGSGPVFTVTSIDAMACPTGEGAPACFQILVQNTGTEAANVRCELAPPAGTTAAFLSGDATYSSAASLAPDQSIPLTVKVDVTEGNDTVISPGVGCAPAS
jgi:hypothetical protein